jgi:predicted nucleic acid-binding protein
VKGFLLDTNVPSELTRARSAPQVERWLNEAENEQLFFSVISLAEICKGIAKLPESRKRAQLQDWLDSVLRPWFAGRILPVTEGIAERMGRWAGHPQREGFCRLWSSNLKSLGRRLTAGCKNYH